MNASKIFAAKISVAKQTNPAITVVCFCCGRATPVASATCFECEAPLAVAPLNLTIRAGRKCAPVALAA